jgi:uncharacterized membrane protein/glycosyltransferase involved in cell wall biosynthesis
MSIVVICYNGEATIERTLDSLLALDYPRKKFEIILVDDGSTDRTGRIARSYKKAIKYVRLTKNRGVSAARNAGLKVVKGDIYVSCDADCIVDRDWLRELAKGYALDTPIGVGGHLVEIEAEASPNVLRRYIGARGRGFPPAVDDEIDARAALSPLKRLWRYLKGNSIRKSHESQDAYVKVEEFYGANATFPVEVLKAVHGWRSDMSWIEDRDISLRIRRKFPDGHFYAMRGAVIKHDPAMSLKQFLLRPYRRGPVTLRFHRENNITPPLFPFPIIFFSALIAVAFLKWPYLLPVVALLLPQLLYFWWLDLAESSKKTIYLAFPYFQLAEETMVMTGLFKGYVTKPRASHVMYVRNLLRLSTLASVLATVAWAYFSLHSNNVVLKAVLSTGFLTLVPGYFGFRAVAGDRANESKMKTISYSLGLSLILLMLTGLLVNEVLPFFGNNQPLTPRVLTFAIGIVTTLLILAASQRKRAEKKRGSLRAFLKKIVQALPITIFSSALPVLATGGAITLNNGGSNWLALTAFGLIGAFFIVLAWKNKNVIKHYPFALYSICLALLLGTSMRGWNITGHDVMQEYQVFQLTLQHAAWHMYYYQDAYNACLSITILPTILQELTGISDPYIYKFVFQLFAAMLAPVIYLTLRDYVPKKTAFLVAFTFMTFPTFLTDITMLNRQTVALLCFALSLQVGLDLKLSKIAKSILVSIFLSGMILSHYSTSYIAIGVLGLALVLEAMYLIGLRLLRKRKFVNSKAPRAHTASALLYGPFTVFFACLVIFGWGTLATHTSGNIAKTLTGLVTSIPHLLASSSVKQVVKPTGSTLSQYLTYTKQTRTLPASDYYSSAVVDALPVIEMPQTTTPASPVLSHLHVSSSLLTTFFNDVRQVYAIAIEGLIGVGLLLILLRKVRTKLPRQYVVLGVASLFIIGLQVVAPSGVIDYGILRVIQQSLILLALPIILACFWILGKLRVAQSWQHRVVAVILLFFFLVLSGLLSTLTGGFKPVLALDNSGFYYEAYYTHQDEITADTWLLTNSPKGSRVYADEFARRKMITYTDSTIFAQPILAPVGVPIDSYVYLSNSNMTFGDVSLYYNGNLTSYKVPQDFFNKNKNLLYSSGQVVIYK